MAGTVDLRAAAENGQVICVCPRQGRPCRSVVPGMLALAALLAAILAVLNRLSPRE
jgi:hypothetical protein